MCGLSGHAQPLYFYLQLVSVWVNAALKGQMIKRGIASWKMADLYAPQGVDLRGVAPPQDNGTTPYKSGLCRNKCKVHEKMTSMCHSMCHSLHCIKWADDWLMIDVIAMVVDGITTQGGWTVLADVKASEQPWQWNTSPVYLNFAQKHIFLIPGQVVWTKGRGHWVSN